MEIREYGDRASQIVLIQPIDRLDAASAEKEYDMIRKMTDRSFMLRTYAVNSWNDDLSPWEAPAVFGNEGFAGKAEETLREIEKDCRGEGKAYLIGGYSLAGLFALWSACRTDVFSGVAAASPSVWFPGFADFLVSNGIRSKSIYLSLGDKEAKTRNPVMSTVADRIRETYSLFQNRDKKCILEWNEGNHFREPDLRTAKAFAWLLNN